MDMYEIDIGEMELTEVDLTESTAESQNTHMLTGQASICIRLIIIKY